MCLKQSANNMTEDLAGTKVSHDFEALEDGEELILTLKDSRILEDEGQARLHRHYSKLICYFRGYT